MKVPTAPPSPGPARLPLAPVTSSECLESWHFSWEVRVGGQEFAFRRVEKHVYLWVVGVSCSVIIGDSLSGSRFSVLDSHGDLG